MSDTTTTSRRRQTARNRQRYTRVVNGKRRYCKGRAIKNQVWFLNHGPVPKVPCHWCREPLSFNEATIDHEPPLSQGGTYFGAVIACDACNSDRGRRLVRHLHLRRIAERFGDIESDPWLEEVRIAALSPAPGTDPAGRGQEGRP